MFVIGFILVIGGIWLVWRKTPVYEGLADTSQVVMAVVGSDSSLGTNTIYYADTDLSNRPNWSPIGATYDTIYGSMGRLIGIKGTQAYYGTKFSNIDNSMVNWLKIPGEVKQVSFDYPMLVGLTPRGTVVYINNIGSNPQTATWIPVKGVWEGNTFNYIATSQGAAIGARTDNQIFYCRDIIEPAWVNISTGILSGILIKHIAFEGDDVVIVDTSNKVYFANNMGSVNKNIGVTAKKTAIKAGATPAETAAAAAADAAAAAALTREAMPNWRVLKQQLKQVSIRNHMAVGIGIDNLIYFAAKIDDDVWIKINGQGSWIDMFYPAGNDTITFRPAVMAIKGGVKPCPDGYTLQGSSCYSNCPEGYRDSGASCVALPVLTGKLVTPNDSTLKVECSPGYEFAITGGFSCKHILNNSIGPKPLEEVYLVKGSFTQDQAQDKCATYGGRLATYQELVYASYDLDYDAIEDIKVDTYMHEYLGNELDYIKKTIRARKAEWYTAGFLAPGVKESELNYEIIVSKGKGYPVASNSGDYFDVRRVNTLDTSNGGLTPNKPINPDQPRAVYPEYTLYNGMKIVPQFIAARADEDDQYMRDDLINVGRSDIRVRYDPTNKGSAICYGVKPPINMFSDIQPVQTTSEGVEYWNANPQCQYINKSEPPDHVLYANGSCISACPSGSQVSSLTKCVATPVPKTSVPAASITCPSGFSDNDENGNCYENCPSGYAPSNVNGSQTAPLTLCGAVNTSTGTNTDVPPPTAPIIKGNIIPNSYFTVPGNWDDQTVQISQSFVRYVRIRPSTTYGDGYINLSQIMVYDTSGNNIALGKKVNATSSWSGTSPSFIVDGSTSIRGTNYITTPIKAKTDTLLPPKISLDYPVSVATSTPAYDVNTSLIPQSLVPPTTPRKDIPWLYFTNVRFPGLATITTVPYKTEKEVKDICLATPGCGAFSYKKSGLQGIPGTATLQVYNPILLNNSLDTKSGIPDFSYDFYYLKDKDWNVSINADYSGQGDLTSVAGTVDEVKAKCLATPSCNTFTYFPNSTYAGGTGYLKNIPINTGTLSTKAGSVVYRLTDAVQNAFINGLKTDPNWDVKLDVYYPGGDLTSLKGTIDEVKAKCLNTPGCNNFIYSEGIGYLKKIPANTTTIWPKLSVASFMLKDGVQTAYLNKDPNWTYTANSGYMNQGDIGSLKGTIDQVKAKCLATFGCNTFTYVQDTQWWSTGGTGYLKNMSLSSGTLSSIPGTSMYKLKDAIQVDFQNSLNSDMAWTAVLNSDYPGGDIGSATGTVEQVKAKCIATAGCNTFAYFPNSDWKTGGTGWMKNIPSSTKIITKTGGITFKLTDSTVASLNSDPNWTYSANSDYIGQGDITSVGPITGTVDQVKAKCLTTPGCNTFTYFPNSTNTGGTGWLKNIQRNTGTLSTKAGAATYRLSDSVLATVGMWHSASNNKDYEMIEIDLGGNRPVSSIRLLGRSDYNYTTSGIDRMTGLRIEVFASTTFKLPKKAYSQLINLAGMVNTPRYIRIRPASTQDGNGDGYIALSQVVGVSLEYNQRNYDVLANKAVYVTSSYPSSNVCSSCVLSESNPSSQNSVKQYGNLALPLYPALDYLKAWPGPMWHSATNNRETEYLEIDIGKNPAKRVVMVYIYGRSDLNSITGTDQDRMTNMRIELIQEQTAAGLVAQAPFTCPAGFTPYSYNVVSGGWQMCVGACPKGSTITQYGGAAKPVCVFPTAPTPPLPPPITRKKQTVPTPCQPGTTRSGSLCYSVCTGGTVDTGVNSCRLANTARALGPVPKETRKELCDAPLTYVSSVRMCSVDCPGGESASYVDNKTLCSKATITRDKKEPSLSYTCGPNEVLQNGVCLSKCPDGSYPDGELCKPQIKIVPVPSDAKIQCTSTPYLKSKKWQCESKDDMTSLLKNPTPATAYVDPTDQVCVTDDPTTKMYYCVTGAEAIAGGAALKSMKSDYSKTCTTIKKSYLDLSNNLTNLVKIRDGMEDGSIKLGDAKNSLNSIYGQMPCTNATGNQKRLCDQIRDAASSIGNNSSDVRAAKDRVIPSLTQALATRDSLLAYKSNFQCK